jgi:hypothetical protein
MDNCFGFPTPSLNRKAYTGARKVATHRVTRRPSLLHLMGNMAASHFFFYCRSQSSVVEGSIVFLTVYKKEGVPLTPLRTPLSKSDSTFSRSCGSFTAGFKSWYV